MARTSMLEAVKIQARVMIPVVRALEAELGKGRAHALVGRAIAESWAGFVASRTAELDTHPSAEAAMFDFPVEGEVVASSPDTHAVNMTGCAFARWFREIGEPEIGALLTCNVDFEVNDRVRPGWELKRTQTQMQGAAFCDFRWRRRGASGR